MSLYSQMQSIAGPSSTSGSDEPVQRELQGLLRQLNWSYAALWTFNHHISRLEWRGGHFQVNSTALTAHGDTEVWNEHLFNSTYKSCTISSGQGSVGMAYTETRSIWMNGPSVHLSAGSKEQAQFLQQARIETAVCIPWAGSVLELGTRKIVAENLELTASLCFCLSGRILPSLAASGTMTRKSGPFPPLNPTQHLADKLLDQNFELNSLNEQMRRSSSISSLNIDMFLHSEEQPQIGGKDLDSSIARTVADPRWRPAAAASGAATQPPNFMITPPNQAMRVQQSNTTSSSVSISEDGSVRLSPRITPAHSPENLQSNVISNAGVAVLPIRMEDDDIQLQAITHMLEEVGDQTHWRNMYMNQPEVPAAASTFVNVALPSTHQPGHAFKSWRHPRVRVAPAIANNRLNQALLRRCIQMLKLMPPVRQASSSHQAPAPDVQSLPGARLTSNSASPEVEFPDIAFADEHSFDQTAPLREPRRPRGPKTGITTGGPVNPTHDEAAMNHMMNERKRRIKQKEYFSTLRKLVPIISKADKASTLGDAIMYIKDLQESISNLETSRAQIEAQYENLKKTSEELEDRNKELEAMLAGSTGGTSSMSSPRIQSSSQSI